MNYAIFRTEPIYKLSDLGQIGSHNKREKKAYQSNKDIDVTRSDENITIIDCDMKYIKKFDEITKEYKKEHDIRMKTMRDDRKKTFHQTVDDKNNVVADEMLFTATHEFFDNMSKEDIIKWSESCMDFVYNDLGYTKEQVLHSVIHLDEKTPHIHCVVVPLVRKYDKRTNCERYSISKKEYIKDKEHLSLLQDRYHQRLVNDGYALERGIKNSDNEHIAIKEYKKITRKITSEINEENVKLTNLVENFEDKMKTTKEVFLNNDYVKVKKDTFDSMKDVVKQSKKIIEKAPKLDNLMNNVDYYVNSYKNIEKENANIKREVTRLKNVNESLKEENSNLKSFVDYILDLLKILFRKILRLDNEQDKDLVVEESTYIYDEKYYNKKDMIDIAKDTTREDEIFDYIDYSKSNYYEDDYEREKNEDKGMEL